MADSSSPVDTTPGDVASSRYAGAAQVLGYDQKQADWVAGREELIRVREARVRRRKRLVLGGSHHSLAYSYRCCSWAPHCRCFMACERVT